MDERWVEDEDQYAGPDLTVLFVLAFVAVACFLLIWALVTGLRQGESCHDRGGVYVQDQTGFDYECIEPDRG